MFTLDEIDLECHSPIKEEADAAMVLRTVIGFVAMLLLVMVCQGIFAGHEHKEHVHAEGTVSLVRNEREE